MFASDDIQEVYACELEARFLPSFKWQLILVMRAFRVFNPEKNRTALAEVRRERMVSGKCVDCGMSRSKQSKARCVVCLSINRTRARESRERRRRLDDGLSPPLSYNAVIRSSTK